MGRPDDRDLIDDQIRYYRARAAEYDETFPNPEDPLGGNPRGRVLELAVGTEGPPAAGRVIFLVDEAAHGPPA
ncbi:MAG: hypothetical protein ACR2K4_07345 [Candidatus Limnocylindria bacterium]